MSLFVNQLLILMWKSLITLYRHWISTICTLVLPLVLPIFLAYIYGSFIAQQLGKVNQTNIEPAYIYPESGGSVYLNKDRTWQPRYILFYGPSTPETDGIMDIVNNLMTANPCDSSAMVDIQLKNLSDDNTYGIIFDVEALKKNHLKYTIRSHIKSMLTDVNKLFEFQIGTIGRTMYRDSYYQSYGQVLIIINDAFVKKMSNNREPLSAVHNYEYPYPSYERTDAYNFTNEFVVTSIVIGLVIVCTLIVKRILDEKVTKAKQMLQMVGLSDWVFWLSHFLTFLAIMVLHSFAFVLIFFIGWKGEPIFVHSNMVLIFTIFVLFSAQTILFCMTLTTVLNQPILAIIVTVILWISSYAIPLSLLHPLIKSSIDVTATNKYRMITSFLPPMGFSWTMSVVGRFESDKTGAHLSNLFTPTTTYGDLTVGVLMLLMLLSCFFYIFLIWYLDNVWPFQYGVPKSPLFPFYPSYWCPTADVVKTSDNSKTADKNFETEPEGKATIEIKKLNKVFYGFGFLYKSVVKDLSLNIYPKQITALLGHNGAGKTTTMNMITGIYPSTSGTVLVNGFNIKTDTKEARRSIGLCPQENIIINELTVGQHLKLFAIIKGVDWTSAYREVEKTLELLKLSDKTDAMANSLSGGMQRKLSLGIAFVGGTKTLILDEPSSGLDPENRRLIWDLLQGLRSSHTILFTTHYMEEADVLGDRIAIMCDGSVKCCGSPMFLKKRFGAGYHLRISKDKNFNPKLMEDTLHKYLPKSHLNSEIQSEVIYVLAMDDNSTQNTSVFPKLFDEIETNKTNLGIVSCGLTVTTMEDVFIRVGNEFEGIDEIEKNRKFIESQSLVQKKPNYLSGFYLNVNQFYGLLLKRFHIMRRYWPMAIFQIVLPAAIFVLAFLIDNSIRSEDIVPTKALELNLFDLYGKTKGFVKSPDIKGFEDYYRITANNYQMSVETPNKTNISEWALEKAKNIPLDQYLRQYLIGAAFEDRIRERYTAYIWSSREATHSRLISINLFFESYLRYLTSNKGTERLITVINHPYPSEDRQKRESEVLGNFVQIILAWALTCLIFTPIAIPFISASYLLIPITERASKAKLLQIMTGLSTTLYWIANYIYDLIIHAIVVTIIVIIFVEFDKNNTFFTTTPVTIALLLLIILFGVASIPLAYCFSLWFSTPSSGFATLVIIYLIFGVITIGILTLIDLFVNVVRIDIMTPFTLFCILIPFRLVPVFSMGFGIQKLYRMSAFEELCKIVILKDKKIEDQICGQANEEGLISGCCQNLCTKTDRCFVGINPLGPSNMGPGPELLFLIISAVLSTGFLIFFENNNLFRRLWYSMCHQSLANQLIASDSIRTGEDSDVMAERNRVLNLFHTKQLSDEALVVIDLTKIRGYLIAVKHLTFGLHKKECFGLLGVNGAGKTTTFSMLTGEIMLSDGNAFIGQLSVKSDLSSFQQKIGYCPQFDALLDKLTGSETLYLFGRLRGIPSDVLKSEVDSLIKMCDLQQHSGKCTDTYSGGTRRKLSLALAIIGTPAVIFLDEPTAGVDPGARRMIWMTLVYIQKKYESAIVLTSHSMEECEALCSRLAIMVNGQFKCFGSTQHLRTKFGQGFTIVIKLRRDLNNDPKYVTRVQQSIQQSFPSAILKDAHQLLLHYHITDTTVQWSHMFSVMERAKHELQLEDYLVSDTTLEQIFLSFAKTQQQIQT